MTSKHTCLLIRETGGAQNDPAGCRWGVRVAGEAEISLTRPARLPEIERRCRSFSAVLVAKTSGSREFTESRFTLPNEAVLLLVIRWLLFSNRGMAGV
ncbi:hypothetical protein BHE74_00046491 [Ensete ventricosum]|nr:hypothetical protein BHE74_00046491 [Ensete ventricosum]RZR77641.1 hypothetical protein BHM03_00002765 [Ensete ventricosum]